MNRIILVALAFACALVGFTVVGSHLPDALRLAALATILFVVADVPTFLAAAFERRFPAILRTVSLLAIVTVALFAVSPAFAQGATPSPTVLPIQWGDMANGLFKVAVEALYPVVLAAVAYAAGKLPWWVSMWLTTQRIDRALQTGADYALNAVAGATAGKALNVDVGYTVLKVALERILGSTPDWLIKEMGGPKGISERLFRVFKFDETVSDKNTLTPLVNALPTLSFVK